MAGGARMIRRIPLRWLVLGAVAVVLLGGLAWVVVPLRALPRPGPSPAEAPLAPTPGAPWFADVTAAAGITFVHFDSATPRHYIQETMGSGLAWIDYDNDGWPDLFCVQAGPLRPGAGPGPTNRL